MASISSKIRESISGLIDATAHIDVAKTTEIIAKKLGLSERLIQYTHVEIRNFLNESRFKRTLYGERLLFLPQCLRNSKKCKAELGEEGWICKKCGNCKIPLLVKEAEKYGYAGTFIVPGGSMVGKLIKKYKPKAVVGVGCFDEVNMAIDQLKGSKVAPQGVCLLKSGCKDTDVNVVEVKEKIALIDKKLLNNKKQ